MSKTKKYFDDFKNAYNELMHIKFYLVYFNEKRPHIVEVSGCHIHSDCDDVEDLWFEAYDQNGDGFVVEYDYIGDLIFDTREEAEKAVDELKDAVYKYPSMFSAWGDS